MSLTAQFQHLHHASHTGAGDEKGKRNTYATWLIVLLLATEWLPRMPRALRHRAELLRS